MTKRIAMIPARMGSQRLAKKNLREINGVSLIRRAIHKCIKANCFDEIWVNSEHIDFRAIAQEESVRFHQRPEDLGNNNATSEQYIGEFLQTHQCHSLFQVHSIAPLMSVADISNFVAHFEQSDADVLLSTDEIQIECALNGKPINFSYESKTNSQELTPIQRVSWSITGWRRETYLNALKQGMCATYHGNVSYFPINHLAAHVIKTEEDLQFVEALLPIVETP